MSISHDRRATSIKNWRTNKTPIQINDQNFGYTKKNNKWKLVPIHEISKSV